MCATAPRRGRSDTVSSDVVSGGGEQAIHGLLKEWARRDSGVDEAFVQRVMSGLESDAKQRFQRGAKQRRPRHSTVRLRPRRRWWPLALAAGVLVAIGLTLLTVHEQALRPLVTSGSLALQRAGKQREINAGARLSISDALTAITAVTIEFTDGTRLELSPQARLVMDGISPKQLRFERGIIDATVAKQPAGAPLTIRTPQVVVEVLGTAFRLETGAASVLTVCSGQVRMSAAAGSGVVVGAGQRAVALSATAAPVLESAVKRIVGTASMHADWYADGAEGSAAVRSFPADHGWRGGEAVRLEHHCSAPAHWANLYFNPHACRDWRGFDALALWCRGPGSGAMVTVEVASTGEQRFIFRFPDDRSGWRRIIIPFAEFVRRPEWQPAGAPDTALNLADIRGLNICLGTEESGWFELDDIALMKTH